MHCVKGVDFREKADEKNEEESGKGKAEEKRLTVRQRREIHTKVRLSFSQSTDKELQLGYFMNSDFANGLSFTEKRPRLKSQKEELILMFDCSI